MNRQYQKTSLSCVGTTWRCNVKSLGSTPRLGANANVAQSVRAMLWCATACAEQVSARFSNGSYSKSPQVPYG
jgi:hypothetical protein